MLANTLQILVFFFSLKAWIQLFYPYFSAFTMWIQLHSKEFVVLFMNISTTENLRTGCTGGCGQRAAKTCCFICGICLWSSGLSHSCLSCSLFSVLMVTQGSPLWTKAEPQSHLITSRPHNFQATGCLKWGCGRNKGEICYSFFLF